jgi:transcriptional regulator with GAF, ATPase, and Fis domain
MDFFVYAILDEGSVIKIVSNKTEAKYFTKINKGTTFQAVNLTLDETTLKTLMRELKVRKNKTQTSKQKENCVEVFHQCNGNIGIAARKLGITYENLYNNLRRQGIIGKLSKKDKEVIENEQDSTVGG